MKKITWMVALATVMLASPSFAQIKTEIGVQAGWTFSDGVDTTAFTAGDGNIYNRADPKDSFKWGLNAGALVGDNGEVGFMYSQQMSALTLSGTNTKDLGDMKTNNYHGYFGYNFGESDMTVRPYFFGGLGATSFTSVPYTRLNGQAGTIPGQTRFSTTWGAGVKIFPHPGIGIRLGAQWTPTFIKADEAGWWCDPYWGCYVAGNYKYSSQLDLTGGILFRF